MSVDEAKKRMAIYMEIDDERGNQESLGYDPDHDDEHNPRDWASFMLIYLGKAMSNESGWGRTLKFIRRRFIQVAALCVAAIESFDRQLAGKK